MNLNEVRVFKAISGEMIVGKVTYASNAVLSGSDKFTVQNPMFLHHTPQGVALVPMLPWAPPDADATLTFNGSSVMGECDMDNPCHAALLADYQRLTSRIMVAAQAMPGAGNVLPFSM